MTAFFQSPFLCIGHRGAPADAPENTLRSFALAIEQGVDALELDVHRCDDQLIVIHDDELQRTTSGYGRLATHSLDEVRALDAGDGEQVPLLQEVLDLIGSNVPLNIELKGPGTAAPVIELLRSRSADPQQFLLSSFDHSQILVAQQLAPEFPRAALFHRLRQQDLVVAAAAVGACCVNLHLPTASPERVATLRDAGLEVLVYTVNDLDAASALARAGASGVFTDHPGRLRAAMTANPARFCHAGGTTA